MLQIFPAIGEHLKWDDILTLGLELDIGIEDIYKIQKSHDDTKDVTTELLCHYWDKTSLTNKQKWSFIIYGLCEMGQIEVVNELCLSRLCNGIPQDGEEDQCAGDLRELVSSTSLMANTINTTF